MNFTSGAARTAAGIIALLGWIGLAVQLRATMGQGLSMPESVWIIFRYFTVLTNLLVAVVFTGIALGKSKFASPVLLGGVTIYILFVGVAYVTLLRGLLELSGGAMLADIILHYVMPVLVLLYWLTLVSKGALTGRDPFRWSIYPLIYVVYALARGAVDNKYPYPFLDVGQLGWSLAAINIAMLLIGFLVSGYGLVWVDGLQSARTRPAA